MPVNPKAKRDAERKNRDRQRTDEERERPRRGGPTDEGRRVAERAVGSAGDLQARYDRLLEVSAGYADELAELRQDRRDLRAELAEYTAEGVVVLTPDEAKQWTAYAALGKPEDVKKLVDLVPDLQAKVTTQERRTDAAKAAELLGWKNTEAAVGMILDKKLNVSFVDGQDGQGKAIKIPHVKPEGADDKVQPTPLKTWQEQNAGYLSGALTLAPAATGATSQNGAHGAPRTGGTQMVEQGGANRGTASGGAEGTQPGAAATAIPGVGGYKSPGMRAADKK